MELVPLALMYLSYASILGAETARVDIAAEMKKKWIARALGRVKRDVHAAAEQGSEASAGSEARAGSAPFIRPEDVKDTLSPWSSSLPHLRVKRYRQSLNNYPHFQSMRVGCRFGTCTVQNLAHQIFQYTDKYKDGTAPAGKIGSLGYGRRRRRSAPREQRPAPGQRRTDSRRLWEQLQRVRRTLPRAPLLWS